MLIVKLASALTTEEKETLGLTGIPDGWPVESYVYESEVPEGFIQMSEEDFEQTKANLQAAYDAWLQGLRPIVVQQPEPVNPDGVKIVELALRKGKPGSANFTIVSPDFSDRSGWYQKSSQVSDETLTTSDNLIFNATHQHWVNIDSPKLTLDYKKVLERDGSLTDASLRRVVVKVDDVPVTSGFSINYDSGTITFDEVQTGVVTASYWHTDGVPNCSEFLIVPPAGFMYRIHHIECQFSRTATFLTPIRVEIWAGSTTGTEVNLAGYQNFSDTAYNLGFGQSRSIYRNTRDLINWCTNQYPPIPACGDLEDDVMCFPFLYIVHPEINPKQGTLIRLLNDNDIPLNAEISTVTFYIEKVPTT